MVGAARSQPDDHPGLFANRQFRNANIGMLFFGGGAMGSLLLLSLLFVNLWGYTQLEAGARHHARAADGARGLAVRGPRGRLAPAGRAREAGR